jgi:hypothetical protein
MTTSAFLPFALLPDRLFPGRFGSVRQLLELLAQLGRLDQPITTPGGLRQAIQFAVAVGRLVGLDAGWLERLQTALDNEAVFGVVLALVRLAAQAATASNDDAGLRISAADADVVLTGQAIADWLPIVLELVELIRLLRGRS